MESPPSSDADGSIELRPIAVEAPAWRRLVESAIKGWALLGGALIAALAVMTAASALSNILLARSFAADYELVKHFVAVAIFMFLPYCQLSGANVSVDIFTENMGDRAKSAMSLIASVLAILFALVLLRQMSIGMMSYMRYPEMTPVLHLPLWTAFPPMLVSSALLLVAAIVTAIDGWRGMRGLGHLLPPPAPAAD